MKIKIYIRSTPLAEHIKQTEHHIVQWLLQQSYADNLVGDKKQFPVSSADICPSSATSEGSRSRAKLH
jgi:hypothetical protein